MLQGCRRFCFFRYNILNVLFGDNIYNFDRREKRINKKRHKYYEYEVLEDILEIHYNLYKYRHQTECSLAEYLKR